MASFIGLDDLQFLDLDALVDQKQVLYLVKVGAAIFFDLHPYIVAPIGATDKLRPSPEPVLRMSL